MPASPTSYSPFWMPLAFLALAHPSSWCLWSVGQHLPSFIPAGSDYLISHHALILLRLRYDMLTASSFIHGTPLMAYLSTYRTISHHPLHTTPAAVRLFLLKSIPNETQNCDWWWSFGFFTCFTLLTVAFIHSSV